MLNLTIINRLDPGDGKMLKSHSGTICREAVTGHTLDPGKRATGLALLTPLPLRIQKNRGIASMEAISSTFITLLDRTDTTRGPGPSCQVNTLSLPWQNRGVKVSSPRKNNSPLLCCRSGKIVQESYCNILGGEVVWGQATGLRVPLTVLWSH